MGYMSSIAQKSSGQYRMMGAGRRNVQQGKNQALTTLRDAKKEYKPYLDFGKKGLAGYTSLMEDPSSVKNTPGYQFRLGEGQRVIEQGAAAKGGLFSGSLMEELTRYGQNFASEEFDKSLGRRAGMIEVGMRGAEGKAKLAGGEAQVLMGAGKNMADLYSAQSTGLTRESEAISGTFTSIFGMGGGG